MRLPRPTHHTRATHVWTETGKERPLLTVSGRERVNRNAALNAHCPTQVHLDETDGVNAQSTQRRYEKWLIAHPEGPELLSSHLVHSPPANPTPSPMGNKTIF